MIVLVCGGRDFEDRPWLERVLDYFHEKHQFTVLLHGAAKGADSYAGSWAYAKGGIEVKKFPANRKTHGKSAGPLRNQLMLSEGKPNLVIAFPGGTGTADMVVRANLAKVPVIAAKKSDFP